MKPPLKPPFAAHQIAKDTERKMLGKPQIHGAAEPDDETVVPPDAAKPPEPAPSPAMPPEPTDQPPAQGGEVAALQAQLAECHSRIEALEAKVGIKKPEDQNADQKPPMGPNMAQDYDEDYQ